MNQSETFSDIKETVIRTGLYSKRALDILNGIAFETDEYYDSVNYLNRHSEKVSVRFGVTFVPEEDEDHDFTEEYYAARNGAHFFQMDDGEIAMLDEHTDDDVARWCEYIKDDCTSETSTDETLIKLRYRKYVGDKLKWIRVKAKLSEIFFLLDVLVSKTKTHTKCLNTKIAKFIANNPELVKPLIGVPRNPVISEMAELYGEKRLELFTKFEDFLETINMPYDDPEEADQYEKNGLGWQYITERQKLYEKFVALADQKFNEYRKNYLLEMEKLIVPEKI